MNCRICRGSQFDDVLDLGQMPLVNNLLRTAEEPCPRWPLQVVVCRGCSLVQLTETPPPDAMFAQYVYFSSTSQTMVAHAASLVERYVQPGDSVLEIASNDGYLLRHALAKGARVLGVDPARNVADVAIASGVPTMCAYFADDVAERIVREWGRADVLFANNVLAHVPDPHALIAGIARVLAPAGRAHIEVPYVCNMIADGAFDTIYHEHQCYFSATALAALIHAHDLHISDLWLAPVHGGSLHVQIAHEGDEAALAALCDHERRIGMTTPQYYTAFSQRVEQTRAQLLATLARFTRVAAFGAAAKGVVLLNHFGLDREHIAWVADVSPYKQGRYLPGTLQPVVAPQTLIEAKPDAALVLPWNIKDEIITRNFDYRRDGGRFIVAIPEVAVI